MKGRLVRSRRALYCRHRLQAGAVRSLIINVAMLLVWRSLGIHYFNRRRADQAGVGRYSPQASAQLNKTSGKDSPLTAEWQKLNDLREAHLQRGIRGRQHRWGDQGDGSEPAVNHVPRMTGGDGGEEVCEFYSAFRSGAMLWI
jgi:hypothetical protein